MDAVFGSYVDAGYRYCFENGPDVVTTDEEAKLSGINCIGLMHLLVKRLFLTPLPVTMKVLELYADNPYFTGITNQAAIQPGDISFFGRRELPGFINQYIPRYDDRKRLTNADEGDRIVNGRYAGLHTAMFTGEHDRHGNPVYIDIRRDPGTVALWSLPQILAVPRYEILYKTKRPVF